MKVLCIKLPLNANGTPSEEHASITLHSEYHVISVSAAPGRYVHLQIVTDDGQSLALYDSEHFMTVDDTVPDSWSVRLEEGGTLELAPTAWHAHGFWEAYYDGDPAAVEAVEVELRRIR